jgi:hypothetical protein
MGRTNDAADEPRPGWRLAADLMVLSGHSSDKLAGLGS